MRTEPLDNAAREDDYPRPLVIAHRGASGLAPENTLAAFRIGLALGSDGVEMDVQLTADGEVVVIHDALVNRTTGAQGRVQSMTAQQLARLDAGSWFTRRLRVRPRIREMSRVAATASGTNMRDFADERIPTLDLVLAEIAPLKPKRVYIELKTEPAGRRELLDRTLHILQSTGVFEAITLLSFDHEIIRLAKTLEPAIRTAVTFPIAGRGLATARSILKAAKAADADEVALHFGLAGRRTVSSLHEAGLAVSAWTANSGIVMRRLIASEVDGIMTNFPNRLIACIQSPNKRILPISRNGNRVGGRSRR
ncbi:MAG TPA: glycerophosphodiester phosphodiesterase family protein [Blastocatellia bacterium]|nr:glycerophosphodiester phosphodiesterase family protein [Blastocatellia bacterium]